MNPGFWKGRRVLVTGHTGFKGGWLSLLLHRMGAVVSGYALAPDTSPNIFEAAGVAARVDSHLGDLRDRARLTEVVRAARPQVVFHLAAQAIVRRAHADPADTFETNVMGTVNLLEALRGLEGVEAVVVVTSDKVYENHEWSWAYRETDALGGKEPYGVSKACAELVTQAYARSYFDPSGVPIATARAGNVIGGGDWASDRLIPDAMRAWSEGRPLKVRNPAAVRPWQHVLEPVQGYVLLAERLVQDAGVTRAWNFGPAWDDAQPVSWVCDQLASLWGVGAGWTLDTGAQPYEARLLAVDSSRARAELGWTPAWRIGEGLARTVAWYRRFYAGDAMEKVTLQDIEDGIHG